MRKLLPASDKRSYKYYMNKHLFSKVKAKHQFPTMKNATNEGWYDNIINKAGGINLCLDAVGENGHTFGFNFPGTSFDSVTRLVKIDDNTMKVNEELTHQKIPRYAVTTGIATGMSAKEIIMLVSGKRKARIIKKILQGKVTEKVPASILRTHPKCKWIVDKEAVSKL